jgi:site-specific recombinase XerD
MTTKALTTTVQTGYLSSFEAIKSLVVDGLTSPHSRRAYGQALADFLGWWDNEDRPPMSKAVVQRYKRKLQDDDLAPSTINQRLSAIRKLAQEAADNGLVDPHLAAGIAKVRGVRSGGRRSGNWLTREQAQELLNAPDTTKLKGLRDRAVLAILLGAGLRRSECASLTFEHVQQREGRWVLVDIRGKGNKTRSVPLPSWAKVAIDEWAGAAGITEGLLFRAIRKDDKLNGTSLSSQAIYDVVREYGDDVAAHDLRRTWAKLAHKGGADLAQISLSLGHASVQTTQRYLGLEQDLTDAPCDHLGISLQ